MRKNQSRKSDSLTRARNFIAEHDEQLGVLSGTPAVQELHAAVTSIAQDVAVQAATPLLSRANVEQRKQLEVQIRKEYMAPMASFARAKLRGAPDFAALTRNGGKLRGRPLAVAARAMVTAATPVAGEMVEAKFPATFLSDLTAAADRLDALLADADRSKTDGVAATKGITAALKSGRQALATLDPIVKHLLGTSTTADAWRHAKRVHLVGTTTPAAPSAPSGQVTSQPASGGSAAV
jgi:hypothetical protein